MRSSPLRYRAGPKAARILRARGLSRATVGAWVGVASGPRWLALAGIDRALLDAGFFAKARPGAPGAPDLLMTGASAGAWRALALASSAPFSAYDRLVAGYAGQVFERGASPQTVSAAYRRLLSEVVTRPAIDAVLARDDLRLAIHATRIRGRLHSASRPVQLAALAAATLGRRVGLHSALAPFERVTFTRAPSVETTFALEGRIAPLRSGNLIDVALATGTVPYYMRPVGPIDAAPRGRFVDGGLLDYHVAQPYLAADVDRAVLAVHYQGRAVPTWFERSAPNAAPPRRARERLLIVHPSPAFIASLPDGRLPDRHDFFRYADAPDARRRRWLEAVSRSEALRAALARDLETGDWVDALEPL